MAELRHSYREQIAHLETIVLEMGDQVLRMIIEAIEALVDRDLERAEAVVRGDDELDRQYFKLQHDVLTTIALQAPVASELRFLSCLIHVNIHLERIGDQCVNIAKAVRLLRDSPEDEDLMAQLREMAQHAHTVTRTAIDSFVRRDTDLARRLPGLDDPLDQLNRGIFKRLVKIAADDQMLDWAMRMVLVSRYLERIGDHAVDIGDQTVFVVTGEPVELQSNSPNQ